MTNVTAPQFQQDVNNAADWANGDENTTVTMRLGQQADSPAKVIKDIKDAGSEAAGSIQFTVKGAFADGFTIDYYFELGETATGDIYRYKRPNALPLVVPAGFDPTVDSRFEQWVNTDHNNLTNRDAVGAHDASSISLQGGSVKDAIKYIVLEMFGGGSNKTDAENKTALQAAITSLDGAAGQIIISPEISYGFNRLDKNTWPDFSGLSNSPDTRIFIDDYSFGITGGGGRSGAQRRKWTYTGNEIDGQHNGDFEYFRSNWHGGYFVSHDANLDDMKVINGGAGANRRASLFFATNGVANWRVGQGRITDDNATEEELSQFIIAASGLPDIGVPSLTNVYVINKNDGKQGWNVGVPRFAFDFIGRDGQGNTFNFETLVGEPTFRISGDVSEVRLISKAGGFDLQSTAGTVYSSKLDGRTQTFTGRGGNLNVFFSTDNKSRRFSVRDDIGSLTVVTTSGESAVVFGDDSTTAFAGTIYPSLTGVTDIGKPTAKFKTIYANEIDASTLSFSNLPVSDPNVAGRVWNDAGILKISAG